MSFIMNPYRFGVPFINTKSLNFDGVNEYGTAGSVSDYSFIQNTGIFTISLWAKRTNYTAAGDSWFMGSTGSSAQKGFYFGYQGTSDNLWIYIMKGVGGVPVISSISTSSIISDNNWHHIVVTGDATNIFFYVDNVKETGSSTMASKSSGDSSAILGIGSIGTSTSNTHYGNEDEISIFNICASDAEVSELWNSGCPADVEQHSQAANCVSYWRMGDDALDTNTNITDVIGGLDITLVNIESGDLQTDTIC